MQSQIKMPLRTMPDMSFKDRKDSPHGTNREISHYFCILATQCKKAAAKLSKIKLTAC